MGHTLFLGDSMEFLKGLANQSIDLCLTDPVYGIDYISGGGRKVTRDGKRNGQFIDWREDGEWDKVRTPKEYFDEILRVSKVQIIWGGNYFTDFLPPSRQWLIWDKMQREFSLADCEMAWSSQTNRSARMFTYGRGVEQMQTKNRRYHPTQKPVALMKWCIKQVKDIEVHSVLDPFLGSGSSLVAAASFGMECYGAELREKYFKIAKRRIEETPEQTNLFNLIEGD